MSLMVQYLVEHGQVGAFRKYRWLIGSNLFTAYGMLISFSLQGYALFSIIFSTLSIFVAYGFAISYNKDLKKLSFKSCGQLWFTAAILFNALSSLGAFSLALLLATKQSNQNLYLASIYFFLHFQYNGWFFFGCMGLFINLLVNAGFNNRILKRIFWAFSLACAPAYLLSLLWLNFPWWIFWIVVASALAQLFSWILLVVKLKGTNFQSLSSLPGNSKWIFTLVALSFSIKLILQAMSLVPELSKIAFGFRPIIIGYLHLVLLGVITLFLIGYMFSQNYLPANKTNSRGLIIFIIGIYFNEIILMVQGVGDIWSFLIPQVNLILLFAAIIIFGGILLLNGPYLIQLLAPRYKPKINPV